MRAFVILATMALATVLSTLVATKIGFGFLGAWVIAIAILAVGNGFLARDRRMY